MENHPHINWKLRARDTISALYLLLFAISEAYSAVATALDRHHAITSWEPRLGWALFVLPAALLSGLFLLRGPRPRLGFTLVVVNLCLYAGFLVLESVASAVQPASKSAVWEVGGIWSALFLTAALAAHFLKNKPLALRS